MEPYIHKVQYYETDRMQITHHSNYVRFMEEARVDFLEKIGWGYDRMEAEGISSPVIGITCEYKKTTTFADVIQIKVAIEEFNGIKLKIKYEMTCYGYPVCYGTSQHCFLDTEGRPLNMKKKCPEFYEKLRENILTHQSFKW